MISRLRLAFVRAARASSARRSLGGKCTVVVRGSEQRLREERPHRSHPLRRSVRPRARTAQEYQPSDSDRRDHDKTGQRGRDPAKLCHVRFDERRADLPGGESDQDVIDRAQAVGETAPTPWSNRNNFPARSNRREVGARTRSDGNAAWSRSTSRRRRWVSAPRRSSRRTTAGRNRMRASGLPVTQCSWCPARRYSMKTLVSRRILPVSDTATAGRRPAVPPATA